MKGSEWGFETLSVHAGVASGEHLGATAVPIYGSVSFAYDSAEELADIFGRKKSGFIYSRVANPTVNAYEQRITALEGGAGTIATSSGMSAIATVIFALCSSGDEILCGESLFGGTIQLFERIFVKYGVSIRYLDTDDLEAVRSAISSRTRLVFIETLGNPKLDVPDLKGLAALLAVRKIPLVADCTFTTPYLCRAGELGAALVVHSATKYLTGNGSVVGGVLVDTGTFDWSDCGHEEIETAVRQIGPELAFLSIARRHVFQNTGCCLSPFNAYLHLLGVETLALRMEKHCSNALALAQSLCDHPMAKQVNYPGLDRSRYHNLAKAQFGDRYGGLLTFELASRDQAYRFIDALKLAKNLANLGDAKTLVIHPASTLYRDCTPEQTAHAGVTDRMIRVSVGIENSNDIINDFDQALRSTGGIR